METFTAKQDLVKIVKDLNSFKEKLEAFDVKKEETVDVINTAISKLNEHIEFCESEQKRLQNQFYDRDKLHMIYYINVEGIDKDDRESYVEEFSKVMDDGNDGSVVNYIVPVNGEHIPPVEFHFPPYQPKKKSEYNKE